MRTPLSMGAPGRADTRVTSANARSLSKPTAGRGSARPSAPQLHGHMVRLCLRVLRRGVLSPHRSLAGVGRAAGRAGSRPLWMAARSRLSRKVVHHSGRGVPSLPSVTTSVGPTKGLGWISRVTGTTTPAESVINLYMLEPIKMRPRRRNVNREIATLPRVDGWRNPNRLLWPVGDVPPAEFELKWLDNGETQPQQHQAGPPHRGGQEPNGRKARALHRFGAARGRDGVPGACGSDELGRSLPRYCDASFTTVRVSIQFPPTVRRSQTPATPLELAPPQVFDSGARRGDDLHSLASAHAVTTPGPALAAGSATNRPAPQPSGDSHGGAGAWDSPLTFRGIEIGRV